MYFYGRTQAEAKAKRPPLAIESAAGEPVRAATRTLLDWLAEWRVTFLRASDRAGSTKDHHGGLTQRHVEPLIGHLPLGQVKPSDVLGYCCTWSSSGGWPGSDAVLGRSEAQQPARTPDGAGRPDDRPRARCLVMT